MKSRYFPVVALTAGAHFAYLIYLPSGGFLALRWPRTLWLHLPVVAWGVGVVALRLPCPLTSLESWARAQSGMDPLPRTGFVGHYLEGVWFPANRTGAAQLAAFVAVAASWIALGLRRRRAR